MPRLHCWASEYCLEVSGTEFNFQLQLQIQSSYECVSQTGSDTAVLFAATDVAIEFGLCEILNTRAIKSEFAPEDGKFEFNISDLEAMFPEGTLDSNVDMVYKELPQWEESVQGFTDRYVNTLKVLAEKYPSENLLLITHWGGVSVTLKNNFNDATKYMVDYCGCVELRRQNLNSDGFGESVEFEVVTSHGVSFKDHNVPIHDPVISQSSV